jgi:signal peptidase I
VCRRADARGGAGVVLELRAREGSQKLTVVRMNSRRVVLALIVVVAAAALVYLRLKYASCCIPSESMEPTFLPGDRFLVDELAYGVHSPPKRGDVVVLTRINSDETFMKRVVGVAGDVVEIVDRRLVVNGRRLARCKVGETEDRLSMDGPPFAIDVWIEWIDDRPHLAQSNRDPTGVTTSGRWTVGEGEVFVVGDNRDRSMDSVRWNDMHSPVQARDVRGRVVRWMSTGDDRAWAKVDDPPRLGSSLAVKLAAGLAACLSAGATIER